MNGPTRVRKGLSRAQAGLAMGEEGLQELKRGLMNVHLNNSSGLVTAVCLLNPRTRRQGRARVLQGSSIQASYILALSHFVWALSRGGSYGLCLWFGLMLAF